MEPSTKWMLNKYLEKGGNSCLTSSLNIYFLNNTVSSPPIASLKPSSLGENEHFGDQGTSRVFCPKSQSDILPHLLHKTKEKDYKTKRPVQATSQWHSYRL